MAKNLNVSLAFTANTNEAIAAIKKLQKELNGLATGSVLKDSGISQITPEIQKAMTAAGELQAKLEAATNLKTGKLDLGQFSDSLKKGGVSLQQYANQLNALGPAGRQAFTNLAQSVLQAEAPLIRCSQRVKELGTTLANTARWQLSSSILHGFMGTVQSAYGYAQDLNKSLNDIRIVTGASISEMDQFAAKANKAARALSTTTNEYAKASLIYFQQGDTQAQAMEKAAVTAKMANVTGQSADVVSNQLTAIWNNFNKEGDVAYEHYADVLTKLGAATASSTDEIAGGLEKFAGIADTIGLSYEYAASALATITATSRESEEVVGTALKTIFARIQGLKQGDTLEDGTTLNKYSEALQKVGISIFDQTGELKNMDSILEEMAAKWVTLNKDQQLALAQTVAGVRQYNQMVTLMDNWDFMEENLATAGAADGELNKQAEIYAESWEAARDRVTAAAENLYTKILDDDFFIGFLDGLSHVIDGVSSLVDAFGGLGGVLATIGAIATKVFHKEISQGLRNAAYSIKQFTPAGKKEHEKTKEDALEGILNLKSNMRGREGDAENASLDREIHMQEQLRAAAGRVTEEELKQLQVQMDLVRAMDKRAIAAGKAADAAREEVEDARDLAKAYEKIEARDKAKEDFQKKHQGEENQKRNDAISQAFDDVIDYGANHRKTKHHRFGEQGDYINQQYAQARQRVVDSGETVTADAVRGEFLAGLREAAKSGDEMAKAIFAKVRAAGDEAAQAYGEAMKSELDKAMRDAEKQAGKRIENIGEAVDRGAMTEVRAKDLRESSTALKQSLKTKDDEGKEVYKTADTGLGKVQEALQQKIAATAAEARKLQDALEALDKSDNVLEGQITQLESLQEELDTTTVSAERLEEILGQLSSEEEGGITSVLEDQAQMLTVDAAGTPYGGETSADAKTRGGEDYLRSKQAAQKQMDSENANLNVGGSEEGLNESFNKSGLIDWADQITNTTDLIMGLGSAISSVQGAIDVFNNPDATAWDKISAVISVVIGILPVASTLMTMFGTTAATSGAAAGAGMTAALGPIGGIILAVTALIAAFVLLADAAEAASPEGQLKAAKEQAEELNNALDGAKQAAEELKSAFDGYDSAVEALENCTEGTQEWRDALRGVNNEVLNLLSTYPELATMTNSDGESAISYGEHGEMVVADWAREEMQNKANQAIQNTQIASIIANQNVREKEIAVSRSDLASSVNKVSGTYGYINTTEGQKDVSYQIASYISKNAEQLATMKPQDQAAMIQSYFDSSGIIASTDAWVSAINQLGPEFGALTNEIAQNTAATQIENEILAKDILSENKAVQESDYANNIEKIVAKDLDQDVQAEINALEKSGWGTDGINKATGVNQEARDVFAKYAEAAGITNYDLIDTTGTDKNRNFVYTDANNNEVTVSLEAMKAVVAAANASEKLTNNAKDLVTVFADKSEQQVAEMTAAVTQNVNDLTVAQTQEGYQVAKLSAEELATLGFEGENAQADYEAAFNQLVVEADAALTDIIDDYIQSVQTSMNALKDSGALNELTLAEVDILGNAMQEVFATGGQAALDNFSGIFESIDIEQRDEFINTLGSIDWQTTNVDNLKQKLEEVGISTTNLSEGALQSLIDTMQSGAVGLEAATTKYASLHEIVDGLETGDTISEEQFNKFEEYGIAAEDYFMRMADGTYKLIGAAEEFYNKVNDESVEGFKENLAAAQESKTKLENINLETIGNEAFSAYGGIVSPKGDKQAQSQLDFLSATGYEDTAQLAQWTEDLKNGKLKVSELTEAVNNHIDGLGGMEAAEKAVSDAIDQNNSEIEQNESAILSTAKSLTSLNKKAKENQTSTKSYNKALTGLASQYESCHDEIEDYNKAIEEHGEDSKEAQKAAKELEKALENAEWKELTKGIKGYLDELKKLKDSDEIQKVYKEMAKSINNTFDTSVTEDFVSKNIDLFKQWRNASGEEAQQLGLQIKNMAIMASTDANTILSNNPIQLDINGDGALDTVTDVATKWANMKSILESNPIQIDANGNADMTNLISALLAAGYTAEEVAALIAAIGQTEVKVEGWGDGLPLDLETEEGLAAFAEAIANWDGGFQVTGGQVPAVEAMDMSQIGDNSGGGGGGSKPKKAEPTKKSDIVERYKELEDQLDDVREESDRVKNSLDRLYGAEQEAAIERLLELERQEIALMKQKAEETKKFMQEDLDELMKVSAEVDVEFKVDEKGNLVNYTEEMTELYEELTALETKAGDEWDEKEQEEISALKEKITKLEEAIDAYEETRELLEDINAELEEMAGTPPLPLIKSDYLDIYLEVEDKLDDIEEKISDLEHEAENLTGEERLKVLRQIQELEEERLKTLEEQKEIARQDMEDKKAAMKEIAERNDLDFKYDDNGNITNYISEMEKLNKAYEELYDEVTEDELVTDDELAALDAMREDMEQMEEYALGYRQAMETIEDIQNEIEDKGSGKANDRFVRSDYIDIYKETNDQLDDIDEKIDDLERQADRLTGEERIAKLKEIQKFEKERLEILKKQKEIAKQDLEDRKAALEEIATVNGLLFEFDENGNVTNYEEQLDKMLDKYEEEYTKAMADGVITATEQAILDAIDQDIEELKDAIDAYSDVVEQMEDIQNEMEDISEGGYVDMEQLDEIGDKLHDINQELDDIEEALNDSSKAADRLYGAARIKQMDKTTQMLEKEINALERKKELQKDIIAEERTEVDTATGGKAQYDSNGNITNYHDLIDSRKDAIRAREAELKADGDFTETEAAEIQEMIDELERMEEEIEEYEQALEDQEDIENAIDDAYYEWQDLNAEKLSYKLELTLDVNDRELAKIERQISRLEGNFYSRAEALALMVGGGMGGSSKLGELNSQLGDLEAHYAEVKRAYEAGEISHAAYVEQTQQLQAEIEGTAAEMEALQKQMDSYYKDTLAAARQELNFHISQIEHLTGVLGHYKNILTALGKSQDYEMMGTVLEGQVEALENEVQVAKKAMGMWQQEADEAYAKYQQALASGNQENADMYYQAYQEAINAANEAENKYYSKAQQWAQALKALIENTLAGLAQDLENALTGGTSFENINNQLKRASSLQEEYLTTTNKIYETTKMMRTAQNEIDKTTNSVAKRKLANFITETKQMQNQNKLSKYELSIQQAKYDLLLAEIALEEARFAKSTVRLRRDAEGNFGYIYTADAEAIANAEQKFEDAQNKLYNIGLDGANKYTEKYQQTLSEMYNTLTSLQNKYLQGGFESEEEYNAAVTEAKEYYYEKLKQYSELYSVAINAESGTLTDTLVNNSRIAADAWSTDFADMTQKTEQWMQAVDGYLVEVRAAFVEWERESDRIAKETVGTNLTELKNKVGDIVTESETLSGTIINSVIPAIKSEIDEVQRLTDAYANMAGSMQGAIDKAYALSDALQQDIDASVEQEMAKQDQETEVLEPETGGDSTTPTEPIEDPEPSTEPEPEVPPETPGGDEDNGGDQTPPVDPPHTHSYGSWTTDTPATCTSEGKQIRKCSCGESDVKKIPKLNHKASSTWEKNKTHHWHVCTECGTVMDKAEHTLSNGKCSVCNYEPDKKENGVLEVGDTPTYVSGKYFYDSYGTEPAGSRGQGKKVKVTQVIKSPKAGQDYPIHVESNDSAYGWLKASQLQGYDTGGYTGEWGPFGKLALLHEKELILNKADTENFLASLELLDGILSTIDLYAMNSQFSSMMNSPYIPDLGKEALEQMVSIEASFPNATDKQEIEEAFKDLVNLASQYAHRK